MRRPATRDSWPWRWMSCGCFPVGLAAHVAHGAVRGPLLLGPPRRVAPAAAARRLEPHALAAREPDAAHLRDHRRHVPLPFVLVAEHVERARAAPRDALGRRAAALAEHEHVGVLLEQL